MKLLIFVLLLNFAVAREPNYINYKKGVLKYGALIDSINLEYKINKYLLYAIITYESQWNPNAPSKTGDLGLMQIHTKDTTFKNPEKNLRFGINKLSKLFKKFGIIDGLEAYNKGSLGMRRTNKRNYAMNILRFYRLIKELK